ncbi:MULTISPECIES: septum site-determining protein MinC [Buttiauxella]|jgi:septum site-determining protein MinC|uniref:Probable septum site-determining protein MinC n=1 Tax=Buttiauxella ferragutiae ATCC 51602 TaxID=1354252 RepID=A0ABX2W5X5_9ENTR|nr:MULTISPECIES: septum site-determining protein MinC [Buttiauxella]AYN26308.1 septum site-determining protein MinC [Buttiauxella sp. 3AFRM03]MCE0827711.1 septum site-determining protein MinC [Buttiauxella ferragutiae]OAT26232.1 MinC family septum site-determining protein [Buttiauxella ferragutiae ATCC 51602]TDN54584.1 septum site-determining protein MinC [Buttiauxella sp. JUb87]UNK63389.1 septum site-determining protein MinC [Buttiauxella ferragutiae]
MSNTPIELKGSSFTLSVLHLHDAQPEVILQALQEKVSQAPAFLKNAPVVVNVASLDGSVNWKKVQQAVVSSGLRVVGISGCKDEALKKEIERAGLPLLTEGKEKNSRAKAAPVEIAAPVEPVVNSITKTRLIDTPVRSGQRIYAPNCDLIITNHVSAGAELIADGNIHVYGMMRGRALAGASGDRDAQIFCTNLAAELVSIAGEYWLSEQIPADYYGKAARLSLASGALSVQPLN